MTDRREFEGFFEWEGPPSASLTLLDGIDDDGYSVSRATVDTDTKEIPAYLLVPHGDAVGAAVVIHQHGGQRHLGKSEVAGLVGDPLLAWGPMLARLGFVVLAPDMIGFEDRRGNGPGIDERMADADRHYHAMTSRLVRGGMLMSDVIADVAAAVTALGGYAPGLSVGVAGHSFGGTSALFAAAVDERIDWVVSSGAAGSIASRLDEDSGLEFSLVMPGFLQRWEIADALELVAPRPTLVVSAEDDPYSGDADQVVDDARARLGDASDALTHLRYAGGHALTADRVDDAMRWIQLQTLG